MVGHAEVDFMEEPVDMVADPFHLLQEMAVTIVLTGELLLCLQPPFYSFTTR